MTINSEEINYYIPNTLLQGDIRDEIDKSEQLMSIYMKTTKESKYCRLCYLVKNLDPTKVVWNKEIENKIDNVNLIIECNSVCKTVKRKTKAKKKAKSI